MKVCPTCEGSKSVDCQECSGSGNCKHCNDGACPDCFLGEVDCPECDGSGEVPEED